MRKEIRLNNKSGTSLKAFIENNEVLLTSIAVIGALIVYSKDLIPLRIANSVSFLLTGGIVIVWFEIYFSFPQEVKVRLFLFRYVLLWTIMGIIFCWLYEYRAFWDIFLFIPTSIIIFWFEIDSVNQIVNTFTVTRRIFGIGSLEKTRWQKLFIAMGFIIAVFSSFIFGVYISTGTNLLMDIIKFGTIQVK